MNRPLKITGRPALERFSIHVSANRGYTTVFIASERLDFDRLGLLTIKWFLEIGKGGCRFTNSAIPYVCRGYTTRFDED
jgi:hypothetical protein